MQHPAPDGDDCVAVKSNAGPPSRNITVDDVHCYGSHGLSVGSQTAGGIYNVLFENSSLNGYDSLGNLSASDTGIQIKTDANSGGVTARVTYRSPWRTSTWTTSPKTATTGTRARPGWPARS